MTFNKEVDLELNEVPVVLFELHENSLLYMDREEWERALILLQKAQVLIEQMNLENFKKDRLIIVIIFHNTALCHQMLGSLEEAAIFLETAVLNLEILSLMPDFQTPGTKNHTIYLEGLLRMQLCALFSQLHRHREALYHAQISVRISHFLIKDVLNYAEAMAQKEKDIVESIKNNKKNKVDESKLSTPLERSKYGENTGNYKNDLSQASVNEESIHNDGNSSDLNSSVNVSNLNKTAKIQHNMSILQRNYSKIIPIIKGIISMLVRENDDKSENNSFQIGEEKSKEINVKIDMRNILGFLNQNLYHDYLNITNIMKLKRMDFRDVYGVRCPDLILTRENLMERIMLLITSYFCMGTELRFLKQMQVEGFEDSIDSEFWHGKALELAIQFLPGDAPLVKHIVSSYQKHHSPTYEQIPEDEEVNSKVRIIRPNDGIVYNKISPVIRDIPKPSVKLAPLDLPPNLYNEKTKLFDNEKSTINISDALKETNQSKVNQEEKTNVIK